MRCSGSITFENGALRPYSAVTYPYCIYASDYLVSKNHLVIVMVI